MSLRRRCVASRVEDHTISYDGFSSGIQSHLGHFKGMCTERDEDDYEQLPVIVIINVCMHDCMIVWLCEFANRQWRRRQPLTNMHISHLTKKDSLNINVQHCRQGQYQKDLKQYFKWNGSTYFLNIYIYILEPADQGFFLSQPSAHPQLKPSFVRCKRENNVTYCYKDGVVDIKLLN